MLLLNDTRVLPCRLLGRKPTGGAVDVLMVRDISEDSSGRRWEVLTRGGYSGPVEFNGPLWGELTEGRVMDLEFEGDLASLLESLGEMPLPPYIKRRADQRDREWYQTVYARNPGSIAAPTAGLHFTKRLIGALGDGGVLVRTLTLHVGPGTFMPLRAERLEDHRMGREWFEIPAALLDEIEGLEGRLVAVGTTTTRAIEGYFSGKFEPGGSRAGDALAGSTDIFIKPGYEFRVVDGLLTNFHLPRSTPLALASAFAGRERLLSAYAEAVEHEYRFFSYGDAMLLLKGI
jgi:S-adenosylmethionine:tRNA ribosyltransferase-isomerase